MNVLNLEDGEVVGILTRYLSRLPCSDMLKVFEILWEVLCIFQIAQSCSPAAAIASL